MEAPTAQLKYTQPPVADYQSSSPVERGHGELAARRLKIYTHDPELGRRRKHRATIEIPYEPLAPVDDDDPDGPKLPCGRLVSIVDYDAYRDVYYELIDLDDSQILYGGGLEPSVDDPKFHQQMVYAVTMKTVANFERALGRRLDFDTLTVLPHAFYGRNAFYDPSTDSLCFGYFRADPDNPGANIPNQWIFTCLSADIIAHEMTHAIIDRLRPHYIEPTNPDVLAFHEAMADIVAIFQHFSYPGALSDAIQEGRGDLSRPGPLLDLAKQFGYSTGSGAALRSAASVDAPDRHLYTEAFESHDRGAILVSAVFAAFFATYTARVADLIRLASGGTGVLGEGHLHPDLVNRLTRAAGDTAQRVLDLCIRAFEYLPPIDVTFGDFLRALVTADTELNPDDPYDLRANLVDAFLARGIHPDGTFSLNENSLLWEKPHRDLVEDPLDEEFIVSLSAYETRRLGSFDKKEDGGLAQRIAHTLHAYARRHAEHLHLQPVSDDMPVRVRGFHTMFNVGQDGQLLTEASVQFVQTPTEKVDHLGGLQPRAGTTVVFGSDGRPRYVIPKPLATNGENLAETERVVATRNFVAECDRRDPHSAWAGDAYDAETRMAKRFSFALLHQGVESTRRHNGGGGRDGAAEGGSDDGREEARDGR